MPVMIAAPAEPMPPQIPSYPQNYYWAPGARPVKKGETESESFDRYWWRNARFDCSLSPRRVGAEDNEEEQRSGRGSLPVRGHQNHEEEPQSQEKQGRSRFKAMFMKSLTSHIFRFSLGIPGRFKIP